MKILITKSIDTSSLTEEILLSMSKEDLVQIVLQLRSPEPTLHVQEEKKKNVVSHNYGFKRKGSSSDYCYVCWRPYEKDWLVQVMGNRIGYFDDEVVAAIAADNYLDSIGDTVRPRNRTKIQLFADAKVV